MNDLRPGTMALLGGGVLLAIGTILKWHTGITGISTDAHGLQGIFCLIIGVAVAGTVAAKAFGGKDVLPADILGFSPNQMYLKLGFAAFIISFGLQFAVTTEIGLLLSWIGAAAIVVGAVLEDKAGDTAAAPF